MPVSPQERARQVIALCRGELGFALAGVCAARPSDHARELRGWLDAGTHGDMEWLARNVELRTDPTALMPGARSIVLVADQYALPGDVDPPAPAGTLWGRIARYARGDDYHVVMKKRLHALCDRLRAEVGAGHEFRAFVDTAPILEREHAARAGIGWIGKHTLLIHPERGSYLLLGGVLTTLELAPPPEQRAIPDHCGTCTRCIDACPTGAITDRSVDATRCISYLTIERRAPEIPEQYHAAIGDWLFGCDVCQEVCPHNRPRAPGAMEGAHPAYTPRRTGFDILEVLGWTEEDRRRAFERSSLKRAKLEMIQRNARVVEGNLRRG